MIPLMNVMAEKYVAYFMTAGTKPPVPKFGYCPRSAKSDYAYAKTTPKSTYLNDRNSMSLLAKQHHHNHD